MNWRDITAFVADGAAVPIAQQRIDSLAIPVGSLGRLHEIAIKLAGITGTAKPKIDFCRVLVFSADHGVAQQRVSAFPSEVTDLNTQLMAEGRATISVLADLLGAKLHIVDVGINADEYDKEKLSLFRHKFSSRKIRRGSKDISIEPAMSEQEMSCAIQVGFDLVIDDDEAEIIVIGEMGIGNTTPSSAIISALLGLPAVEVTGPGSGLDQAGVYHKVNVVDQAVARLFSVTPCPSPLEVLRQLGGLELAAIVGAILGATVRRVPVILDGFIVSSSYLVASRIVTGLNDICFAGTRSAERGFDHLENDSGLSPILDLQMRLGEGSAALLAYPIIRAASRHLSDGATLSELSL